MINIEKLRQILAGYKAYFPSHWNDESYKWKAVKHFQDNWNIDADDFCEMFQESTAKTFNLLASAYAYPKGMIISFAKADDTAVRQMFRDLYDESRDLSERVEAFQTASEAIRAEYDDGTWRNHYQNTNAISVYLWLRYPDKYYIYKYELNRDFAAELGSEHRPNRRRSLESMIGGFEMYDDIRKVVCEDAELVDMFRAAVSASDDCYPDPELKTLTVDIGFYLSRFFLDKGSASDDDGWFPKNYNPDITVNEWVDMLKDTSVFKQSDLQIMKRIKDHGGQATCVQLSEKYGKGIGFYNSGSSALARRVAEKSGCRIMEREDSGKPRWWTILYMGKDASANEAGSYIWRLRSELAQALDMVDLSDVPLYAAENEEGAEYAQVCQYWWLNANPKIWSFSGINIGEEQGYTLYNDNGHKRRIFQNFLDVKVGDIVIGYETAPVKKIVALCEITQANDGKNICFAKTEGLSAPIEYSVLKGCRELQKMEFFVAPNGSLFKLTKDEFDFIMDIIRETNPVKSPDTVHPIYTKADFLSDVFMTEERYNVLEALLRNKKNIILQGAPGVGKTFAAKRLAYAMMGKEDESRIELVQFHQNYSYEDFVMGYRPDGDEFKLTDGIFYRFCLTAANHPDKEYFFIIDEINRGNMSKIFGELMMLIEKDYRGTKAALAYNGMPFSVPGNLYIIGMMNTADRSLAMIDYALRRRFGFFDMEPGFNSEGFQNYQKAFDNEMFNALIGQIKLLNKEITGDPSLGEGFRIGHSYFCGREKNGCTTDWMLSVVEFDILPMLREYWFDEPEKIRRWEKDLRGVFDDE